jgi:hypothetical protein
MLNGAGTGSIAGHTYTIVDLSHEYSNNGNTLPHTYVLSHPNSCRSLILTMAMAPWDGTQASGDQIIVQIIQHRLNPQTVDLSNNQVMTYKFTLDGGPVDINVTQTTSGSELYYLLHGSADCYTNSGVL